MARAKKIVVVQQSQVELPQAAEVVVAVEPVVADAAPKAKRYRVTKGVFFNQHGAASWLAVGTIVDESVVGAAHIETLRKHRIPLEEV